MIELFKRLLAKHSLKQLGKKDIHLNDQVWICFPNVGKTYHMVISSIGVNTFTARFINEDDEDTARTIEDYGQYDNDIKFDIKTGTPLDLRKK